MGEILLNRFTAQLNGQGLFSLSDTNFAFIFFSWGIAVNQYF